MGTAPAPVELTTRSTTLWYRTGFSAESAGQKPLDLSQQQIESDHEAHVHQDEVQHGQVE